MRSRLATATLLATFAAILLWPAAAAAQRGQASPEAATGITRKDLAVATRHMISTANPYASEAGREILRAGGSALDAAIAAQLVLGLVEPQSSGLGGGAFLLHFDARSNDLKTYDGRETAPAAARPDRFLKDGRPIPFDTAERSGMSVGVPGVVRMLALAHQRHGRLPWANLFAPAIKLARDGFAVSTRLHYLARWHGAESFAPAARRYFFDAGGSAWPVGHLLSNPEYAETLERIARDGPDAFYRGAAAEAIVAAVKEAPNAAGDLTLSDLESYAAKERPPLCIAYRDNRICGMGPPSSGGVAVAQTLKLIEPFEVVRGRPAAMTGQALHLIAEAEKLAYADRSRYLADPDFIPVPGGLLDAGYLDTRRRLIDLERAMPHASAGSPPGTERHSFGADATLESAGTSHLSIIDADGNAVALTTTIESAFGSHLWAAGFLLNNQLTDFSFRPVDADGRPIANAVAPAKRPRSSMAPTIVFDQNGKVKAVLGSPGGTRIITYVVKSLVAVLDWDLDAQTATDLPNFGSLGDGFEVEYDWTAVWQGLKLKPFGHRISPDLLTSGIHAIVVRNGRLEGGADPRREGAALGD